MGSCTTVSFRQVHRCQAQVLGRLVCGRKLEKTEQEAWDKCITVRWDSYHGRHRWVETWEELSSWLRMQQPAHSFFLIFTQVSSLHLVPPPLVCQVTMFWNASKTCLQDCNCDAKAFVCFWVAHTDGEKTTYIYSLHFHKKICKLDWWSFKW